MATRKNMRTGFAEVWAQGEQLGYVLRTTRHNLRGESKRVRIEIWEAFDMSDRPVTEDPTFRPKVWGGNVEVMPRAKTFATQAAAVRGLVNHLRKRVSA